MFARERRRRLGLLCLLPLIAFTSVAAQETVVKESETAQQVVWRISQPDVRQVRKDYPEVQFRPFDEVLVTGGGCVQTGGRGRTWKRYIDPSGENSDRLYHGRIWIPGATDSLVRISSIEGWPVFVNDRPPHSTDADIQSELFLRLGYEDDKHKDNSYRKHDDGTDNQCSLSEDPGTDGNAWLRISIIHHDAPHTPRDPRAPLDLWWNKLDENFLPFNPDWWIHQSKKIFPDSNTASSDENQFCNQFREAKGDNLLSGKDPRCTMWDPDVDEANALSNFCHLARLFASSVHGHVNWGAATYTGQVYFDRSNNFHAQPTAAAQKITPAGDGDYDWLLVTPDGVGTAAGNFRDSGRSAKEGNLPSKSLRQLALEFSSRETIDRMKKSAWWNDFHKKIDHQPLVARDAVKGRPAIVIGLIGFDNEHGNEEGGARVELHPVWGLAIQVSETRTEDTWAIFARNWGNEGSCSNGWDATGGKWQHYLSLPKNQMKFFFNVSGNVANVVSDFHSTYGDVKKNQLASIDSTGFPAGVLLTIRLPEPEKHKLFYGTLRIVKTGS